MEEIKCPASDERKNDPESLHMGKQDLRLYYHCILLQVKGHMWLNVGSSSSAGDRGDQTQHIKTQLSMTNGNLRIRNSLLLSHQRWLSQGWRTELIPGTTCSAKVTGDRTKLAGNANKPDHASKQGQHGWRTAITSNHAWRTQKLWI